MNHEFGNIGRRLPYDLPEHRLEALHERIPVSYTHLTLPTN